MGGQPAYPRREVAQEVEGQHAAAQIPPAAFGQHGTVYLLAVLLDKRIQIISQGLVELPVVNDQVGLEV